MPGSLFLDSPVPPKLDLAGARSQLFQVPQTPSASTSLYRSISFPRKRTRYESEKRRMSESHADLTSPAPLVSTDYRLAGGGLDFQQHAWREPHEVSAELDYRPSRYREAPLISQVDGSVESLPSREIDENQSRKRTRRDSFATTALPDEKEQPQPGGSGWGRTVINAVGKVLDFCWSGAFGGFYAGGGRGYKMTAGPSPQIDKHSWQQASEKGENTSADRGQRQDMTPIPGQFPYDDDDKNDIQQNWVVVSNNTQDFLGNDASPSMTTKRVNRRNIGPSHTRRRSAVMPRLGKRTGQSSSRPSTPKAQSPPTKARESPASAETQRHVAQMRRMEREEDASLRRLNRQLQAMIKEGKQALGTRIEVDEYDMED
ncbi:hypothetical protein ASPWEDRAFT_44384 [Aspergillus wentii DTO 134E9]|uniref:Uncharacterized protein n=1 Tax=Aspergillus wentii DTO 134E9 TaxID=1073089 RepID=A0A1L9RBI9_ASPWE|nr:uncharacterized protein ASPWEDRAFT_44384 [Aspergillus wentii DTO 134E9]KAI9934857.1 hypothetical protein MW887_000477 [Aspergillus wentii]OJJ32296.1 hypothetical protein ASPWEDRAFT_44384 [Aspergillus wentii DTO 134E9]